MKPDDRRSGSNQYRLRFPAPWRPPTRPTTSATKLGNFTAPRWSPFGLPEPPASTYCKLSMSLPALRLSHGQWPHGRTTIPSNRPLALLTQLPWPQSLQAPELCEPFFGRSQDCACGSLNAYRTRPKPSARGEAEHMARLVEPGIPRCCRSSHLVPKPPPSPSPIWSCLSLVERGLPEGPACAGMVNKSFLRLDWASRATFGAGLVLRGTGQSSCRTLPLVLSVVSA